MFQFLQSWFSPGPSASKEEAKQRLKLLLVREQLDLPPKQLEQMKAELLEVVARYCDVDAEQVDFRLNRSAGQITVVSSVPVKRLTARE